MRAEVPQFEHSFTLKDAERVSRVIESHPRVRAVYFSGSLGHKQTVPILQYVIEVNDYQDFDRFAESFKKEKGDQSIAPEQRMIAISYILGDDLIAQIDACFDGNEQAGNFVDMIVVPPNWRERIDYVQGRLPFDDFSVGDFIDAQTLTQSTK